MLAETETIWLSEEMDWIRANAPQALGVEDHFDIAGREVCIRYSEPALAEALGRATRHLRRTERGSSPFLIIDCWTSPDPKLHLPSSAPETGTFLVEDGSLTLTWDVPGGPVFAYDHRRRHAWAWFGSLATLSPWERATPFRSIFHWWSADQGLLVAHAAAVGNTSGGLLLVGRSGSGKSTTSLACLEAGLGFAGDDYCLIKPGDPPQLHGLYLSAKGDAHTAMLLPGFRDELRESALRLNGKSVLFADQVRPDGICTGFPLRGIVVPRITGQQSTSRLSPLSPAAAFRAMAPSSLLQIPGNKAGSLERLAAIVRYLPAWELTLGTDPATAASLIKTLLDEKEST